MKFEISQILPIYNNENEVVKTNITFKPNEKSIMVIDIDRDLINENHEVITSAVLEQIYNDWFPNRAENEKFNEMDKSIEKVSEDINLNKKSCDKLIKRVDDLEELVNRIAKEINFHTVEIELED
ncbi:MULTISPECIES: DUF1366 domain-containing protein [unclassified Gemella]|uniref:DUF1366 domain-containing protein n=1 Tax=unclassified Gemella TaxID=2624949 RepID=UPI0015D04488|nr:MULTISPECIES: DUF1366 domain-containing protein [unclassified Gemella]MBF0709719.1 DUF1366 domain-containing protein [Gemella sp. GL1.1]NYS27063.1 DUF1366 domain-containing protein [Gemella sp. GL1]